jgi:hypothetical protein
MLSETSSLIRHNSDHSINELQVTDGWGHGLGTYVPQAHVVRKVIRCSVSSLSQNLVLQHPKSNLALLLGATHT